MNGWEGQYDRNRRTKGIRSDEQYGCRSDADRDPKRYIVARLEDGLLWYWGSWDDVDKAYEVAEEFDNALVCVKVGE